MAADKKTLKSFLDTLVVPREVRVTDLLGNTYALPSSVSARQTVFVTRHLQAAVSEAAVDRAARGLEALEKSGDVVAAVVHAIGLVASEEVVGHLARAFGAAHPNVVLAAWKARPTYDPSEELPEDAAMDLFAMEELAAGVVPLFAGLARRSVQLFQVATEAV